MSISESIGPWSRGKACEWYDVCDSRTISDLAGETISSATGGIIDPPVGKEVFHFGLLLAGFWVAAKIVEGPGTQR